MMAEDFWRFYFKMFIMVGRNFFDKDELATGRKAEVNEWLSDRVESMIRWPVYRVSVGIVVSELLKKGS